MTTRLTLLLSEHGQHNSFYIRPYGTNRHKDSVVGVDIATLPCAVLLLFSHLIWETGACLWGADQP